MVQFWSKGPRVSEAYWGDPSPRAGDDQHLSSTGRSKKGKFFLLLHFCFIQALNRLDYFANKGPSSQSYGFSSSQVWMWELDCKESWASKNWCFWTVVLEKTLESPLDWKKVQSVHPKGNKSWIYIGRTDTEAETPILWPPDVKNLFIGKDPDAGKDWRQEEKGTTEDEVVGWHHQLDGHECEQVLGVGDGWGSLASCSPWGCKELDTTEWLNWLIETGWIIPTHTEEGNLLSPPTGMSSHLEKHLHRYTWV